MRAVIVERSKLVGRKIARAFLSAGAATVVVEEPAQAVAELGHADVLCSDTFDADFVVEQVRARPGLRGVLWTAEPLRRSLRHLVETAGIDHVLARRDFESSPRAREVAMVARRFATVSQRPPLAAYLDWGFTAIELEIRGTVDRDPAVARIQDAIAALQVPRRVAEMIGEVAHELIMNALYDAPADASGRPRFAGDRKADVCLADRERPEVWLAYDASRVVLQVRDPFGRLERRHVFAGLARGLGGEEDRTGGGAGLGLALCHHASSALFFDVAPGRLTEVTAVLELDLNLRELRTQAKSLHFWAT
jgi:hypothetical protein